MCIKNEFSYFMPDYSWGYSSLLYDINITWLYNLGGFWAVALFGALLLSLCVIIFRLSYYKSPTIFISIFIWFAGSLSIIRVGYRAQILAMFFLGLLLSLIKPLFKKISFKKEFFLNLLIYLILILWANSHPSFVLGVVGYLVLAALKIFRKKYYYLPLAVIGVLSTTINPLGTKTYLEVLNHFNTNLSGLIAEWVAPTFGIQLIVTVFTFFSLFFIWKSKTQSFTTRVFFSTLLLGTGFLGLSARRHVPLYFVTLLYSLEEFFILKTVITNFKLNIKMLNISILGILAFLGLVNLQNLALIKDINQYYCDYAFVKLPCNEVKHIKTTYKNIFTSYEWGGYLIWVSPKNKVFVDGRMPAWKTPNNISPYTTYLEIMQARKGWQKTLAEHKTDLIFIPSGTFLDIELKKNQSKYQKIFTNSTASLYQKIN